MAYHIDAQKVSLIDLRRRIEETVLVLSTEGHFTISPLNLFSLYFTKSLHQSGLFFC